MRGLKWFSGGVERRREAIIILEKLIQNIKYDSQLLPLKNILISYEYELKKGSISIPYTLSRMNIEISNALIENGLHLSEIQSDQIKKLRELSNIRYGY
ncbi:bacteriocin immunity protein [Streptococcus sp. Marseille-Q5986]|uniref:bacteriocin immunity protein n=1 Tax=Streptococcus sp. Marseille-Q5986 TaxID=2972782 RepID=UPI002265002E|nr:bacteriocin immunity protein [Streptococcus sp. Marseille-Q5986]